MEGTEGTTEPIIAILGHPIAGNPSQFALERALRAMNLEWRALSFDVEEKDIAAALDGFEVLGIRGVLVDASVGAAVGKWCATKIPAAGDPSDSAIDCLYRDQDGTLRSSCELGHWLRSSKPEPEPDTENDQDAEPTDEAETPSAAEDWLWLGESDSADSVLCAVPRCEHLQSPPDPQRVAKADFIVLADTGELESEDWPLDDGSTVVIDLTEGHPEQARLEELGYRVVDEIQRRGGTLCACLKRWTGQEPARDVIRDAIEEYLGV